MVLMKHQEFAWTSLAGVQESALFSLLLSVTVSALFVNCALDEFNIAEALTEDGAVPGSRLVRGDSGDPRIVAGSKLTGCRSELIVAVLI